MAVGKRSKAAENNSAVYKSTKRWEANRKRKLERVLKEQPNNQQVKDAMKSMVYRRKTPSTRVWSHSWKKTAKLIKQFSGKFDKDCMNTDPKKASEAMRMSFKLNHSPEVRLPSKYSFFSLETRIYKGPK